VLPSAVGYGLFFDGTHSFWMIAVYWLAGCCLALAALIRLANFNVEEELRQEQTSANREQFIGMPVVFSAGIIPLLVAVISAFDLGLFGFGLFAAAMPVIGVMFLLKKLHVPKPAGKRLVSLFLVGLVEMILLVCCL
jgi:CDP-diacylglycerol--serine O-phosphatidyltransferase